MCCLEVLLMGKPHIRELYVGDVDGENEAASEDFDKLFYRENNNCNRIINGDKFIIQGKKGTGKTILAEYIKYMAKSNGDMICEICKMNDVCTNILKEYDSLDLKNQNFYIVLKWVYNIIVSELILKDSFLKKYIPFTSYYKTKKLLNKIYPSTPFKLEKYTKTENVKYNPELSFSSNNISADTILSIAEGLQQEYTRNNFTNIFPKIEKLVRKCAKNKKIIVFIDDIDSSNNNIIDNENYRLFLIALINSANNFNLDLKKIGIKCKIVLLIRDDIFNVLNCYDTNINKFESRILKLNWIETPYLDHRHPLIDLVCNKIMNTNSYYSEFSIEEIYKKLFAKCKPNGKNIVEFLTIYGFGRPREVIKFFSTYIEKFPNEKDFSNESFCKSVISEYSLWFVSELKNELSIHKKADYIRQAFDLLSNFNRGSFRYDEIKEYYESNKELYPDIYSIEEMLETFYNFGVLANSVQYKNEKHYNWVYRKYSKKFSIMDKMVLHNAVRKGLRI